MSSYPHQTAGRNDAQPAANDNGGGDEADRAAVLAAVVELAQLMARHEVDRLRAANDDAGVVPTA